MQFSIYKMGSLFLMTLIVTLFLCGVGYSQDASKNDSIAYQPKVYGVVISPSPQITDPAQAPVQGANPAPPPGNNNPVTTTSHGKPPDLSAKGKFRYGLKRAYFSPTTYAFPAISSY